MVFLKKNFLVEEAILKIFLIYSFVLCWARNVISAYLNTASIRYGRPY